MSTTVDYIKRAVERSQIKREKYSDEVLKNIPLSKIKIFMHFGDAKSEYLLSSMLLPRLSKDNYLIVFSYPGRSGLYPYASEYWTIEDEVSLKQLADREVRFKNTSQVFNAYFRSLIRYFDNVITYEDSDFRDYYNFGFQSKTIDGLEYFLPTIPSVSLDFTRTLKAYEGFKILIKPTRRIRNWNIQESHGITVLQDFWVELVQRLLDKQYVPLIWQDHSTYDLSYKFHNKCAYLYEKDFMVSLGAMRASDCVLDVFQGISRHAYLARSPFLAFDDRQRYFDTKDEEIDKLCGQNTFYKNVFSFSSVIGSSEWDDIISHICVSLDQFLPIINKDELPATLASNVKLFPKNLRKEEKKSVGFRFIR